MEKRVVVFLIVSLLIIFGWNYVLEKMGWAPVPQEAEESAPMESSPLSTEILENEGMVARSVPSLSVEVAPEDGSLGEKFSLDLSEEAIVVESDLYRAELTNRGGVVTSWELKRYMTEGADGTVPVQLVYQEGQFQRPLALVLGDEDLTKELLNGLYKVERDFSVLDETHPVGHLTLGYSNAEKGILVEKRLGFHYDSYVVDVSIRTTGLPGGFDIGLGTNFGIVEWGEGFIGLVGPAYLIGDELEKETPDQEAIKTGDIRWVALQDKYFMSALIPKAAKVARIRNEGEKLVSARVGFGEDEAAEFELFSGPKQYDTLKGFNLRLEDTIDFGWFIYGSWDIVRSVAKPVFYVLRFFHRYTENFGLAIILVTVCIKLVFVPLQYKSYKSMKDMQVVQPKVLELQKKFKDDRERLNRELMKLYKDHRVNPVGGCLPMLLQMPVFIALFNILYMTIDLRQAPFILWIRDLSAPDPFYVLPILMGLSMVLQQRIMPTTMDPTQAKMMLMLPVFLTFIFLNFASGLVLYWLTNNVLTIAQQFITDRYIFRRPTFGTAAGAPPGQSGGAGSGTGRDGRSSDTGETAAADSQPSVVTSEGGGAGGPKDGRKGSRKKRKGKVSAEQASGAGGVPDNAETQGAGVVDNSTAWSPQGDGVSEGPSRHQGTDDEEGFLKGRQ